jgi:hypothetical protein
MSRMSLALLSLFLALPQVAIAADTGRADDDIVARYAALTGKGAANCRKSSPAGDIVVCGGRRESDRQRLPFADARADGNDEAIIKGEIRSASAERVRIGGCHTVPGQICGRGVPILGISGSKFNLGTNGESEAPVALKILGWAIDPHQSGPELPKPRN